MILDDRFLQDVGEDPRELHITEEGQVMLARSNGKLQAWSFTHSGKKGVNLHNVC